MKTMTATKTLTSIGLVTLAVGGVAFGLVMTMNDKQASVTNDQIVNQSENVQSVTNPLIASTPAAPICAPGCVPGCVDFLTPQEPQNQPAFLDITRDCNEGKAYTGKCNDVAGEFGPKGIINWSNPARTGCLSYNNNNDINFVPRILDEDKSMVCPRANMDDEGTIIHPPIKPETSKISCRLDGRDFYAFYKSALPEDAEWGNANTALRAYVDDGNVWCDSGWKYPHIYRGRWGGFLKAEAVCWLGNPGAQGTYWVNARMDGICWDFLTSKYCGDATAPANAYIIRIVANKANTATEDSNNEAYGCSNMVIIPKNASESESSND